jgi:hypothetical protein
MGKTATALTSVLLQGSWDTLAISRKKRLRLQPKRTTESIKVPADLPHILQSFVVSVLGHMKQSWRSSVMIAGVVMN